MKQCRIGARLKSGRFTFQSPAQQGASKSLIGNPEELRQLTAFFAWTAWASAANRPGRSHTYTNNFPYDPLAGNTPGRDAFLWSALSLITLLAGTALVLFAFGKFDYLGWKGRGEPHPSADARGSTDEARGRRSNTSSSSPSFFSLKRSWEGRRPTTGQTRGFYGFDLTLLFPTNVLRTWHLQLAIFWIATAYVGGGLFLASDIPQVIWYTASVKEVFMPRGTRITIS